MLSNDNFFSYHGYSGKGRMQSNPAYKSWTIVHHRMMILLNYGCCTGQCQIKTIWGFTPIGEIENILRHCLYTLKNLFVVHPETAKSFAYVWNWLLAKIGWKDSENYSMQRGKMSFPTAPVLKKQIRAGIHLNAKKVLKYIIHHCSPAGSSWGLAL